MEKRDERLEAKKCMLMQQLWMMRTTITYAHSLRIKNLCLLFAVFIACYILHKSSKMLARFGTMSHRNLSWVEPGNNGTEFFVNITVENASIHKLTVAVKHGT